MKRLLNEGEMTRPSDTVFSDHRIWLNVGEVRMCRNERDIIYREVPDPKPEPQWRKISDGPVTYPCWVTDGETVEQSQTNYTDGRPLGRGTTGIWDSSITHWKPLEKPAPPAPEKSEESLAFERWFKSANINFQSSDWSTPAVIIACEAWKAGIAFTKERK